MTESYKGIAGWREISIHRSPYEWFDLFYLIWCYHPNRVINYPSPRQCSLKSRTASRLVLALACVMVGQRSGWWLRPLIVLRLFTFSILEGLCGSVYSWFMWKDNSRFVKCLESVVWAVSDLAQTTPKFAMASTIQRECRRFRSFHSRCLKKANSTLSSQRLW